MTVLLVARDQIGTRAGALGLALHHAGDGVQVALEKGVRLGEVANPCRAVSTFGADSMIALATASRAAGLRTDVRRGYGRVWPLSTGSS
jgi:hypothetical protein